MFAGDEISAVVADVGSYLSRFGFSGEDTPRVSAPSVVGAAEGGAMHVGSDALFRRDGVAARRPAAGDDASQALWRAAFDTELRVDARDQPVMVAEAPGTTAAERAATVGMLFEQFEVPCLFVASSAVLSCFSVGRATGLVVDLGHAGSRCVPVLDGYVLNSGVTRSTVGGEALTRKLDEVLAADGVTVHPRYAVKRSRARNGALKTTLSELPGTDPSFAEHMRLDVVRDIKESFCQLPESTLDMELAQAVPADEYELPDGTVLSLGTHRFRVPELLFHPSLDTPTAAAAAAGEGAAPAEGEAAVPPAGAEPTAVGVQHMVHASVLRCDADSRREFFQHVLVTGGTSLFESTSERLHAELQELIPQTYKVRLLASTPAERKNATWVGGSILATLGSFQQLWLSKAEWEERGESVLESRFP